MVSTRSIARSFGAVALAATLVAGSCESTAAIPSVEGLWLIIGFRTDGVTATTADGQANFLANGSYTMSATITFPGQAPEDVTSSGTWTQDGGTVTLDDGTDTGEWKVTPTESGATVVLELQNDASASRLTLQRP